MEDVHEEGSSDEEMMDEKDFDEEREEERAGEAHGHDEEEEEEEEEDSDGEAVEAFEEKEEVDAQELTEAIEDYEEAQGKVEALKSFVRNAGQSADSESEDDDEEENEEEEEVAEEQKWTKEKAEALEKTNRVEAEYEAGEKTLGSVVKGVTQYQENAHETVKEKKYGQQKWNGMFETEAQRQRGIDLETSLNEIERFSKNGEVPEIKYPNKKTTGVGVASVRNKLEENFKKDQEEGGSAGGARGPNGRPRNRQGGQRNGAGAQGQAGQRGNGSRNRQGNGGGTQQTNGEQRENEPIEDNSPNELKKFKNKLDKGGNKGSEFFKNFQKNEKKKYRPVTGMKSYYHDS